MSTAAELIYDPRDPAVMADPHPAYARLREEDPVHWSPALKAWVITRYEDVAEVLKSDDMSVNRLIGFYRALPQERASRLKVLIDHLSLWLVFRDPPDHTRLRRLLMDPFTPDSLKRMAGPIGEITAMLLDELEATPEPDLVRDYARKVPAHVIMDLLGVPRERLEDFSTWSDDMGLFINGARNAPDKYERAERGARQMAGFFRELIQERRRSPAPGFLQDLLNARDENDALSDDELVATCMLILFAGHETTTNLIGNSLLILLRNREALERFRDDPATTRTAVEEFLRYDGPANSIVRAVGREHELRGRRLTEGERVYAMVTSANRDPRAFENAEAVDIGRKPNRHLTFGLGIHTCMGSQLAREEARQALRGFVDRFPDYRLAGEPEWMDSVVPRGLRRLPARLRP
ncbi:MAG: cytochrome P450 [Pseudomonadota bacterium]